MFALKAVVLFGIVACVCGFSIKKAVLNEIIKRSQSILNSSLAKCVSMVPPVTIDITEGPTAFCKAAKALKHSHVCSELNEDVSHIARNLFYLGSSDCSIEDSVSSGKGERIPLKKFLHSIWSNALKHMNTFV